ncbi:MAG: AAA family ATPase [Desulforudis sp.]|jgi:hypothetical protein|nr:MAG: AAA family ATPase [Desulforudis sp.]
MDNISSTDTGVAPCWLCPQRDDSWPDQNLLARVSDISRNHKIAFVLVGSSEPFAYYYCSKFPQNIKPWVGSSAPKRVVVLWGSKPLEPTAILSWRCGLIEEEGIAYKFIFLVQRPADVDAGNWLLAQLGSWVQPQPIKEAKGIKIGKLVSYIRIKTIKQMIEYDPSFLTFSPFGRMGEVLDQLDECKRTFRNIISRNVKDRRTDVHNKLEKVLAYDVNSDIASRRSEFLSQSKKLINIISDKFGQVDRNRLPKVLLLGPSGAGKTLVARYLAWATSPRPGEELSRPFKRVPCPEYLQRESDFEYDVFGYCAGAFTGAHPDGKKGFLLERMGGVVFFDEIGDASPVIQAKLLAYLDDYQVTPRGWSGDSMFCPMLVVAATNRPIDIWSEASDKEDYDRRFRNDLYRRFNYVINIPSLNERKRQELPYILDVMLQMEAFNPRQRIQEIGKDALEVFLEFDYDKGNFRDLETKLRRACRKALSEGRQYIVKSDIE